MKRFEQNGLAAVFAVSVMMACSAHADARFVEGEVIVKYRAGVSVDDAKTYAARGGLTVARSFGALTEARGAVFSVVRGALSTGELMRRLEADPNVEAVSPNYIRTLFYVPNDPKFYRQWSLNNTTADADLDAPQAWEIERGVSDTVVAVIDTGVDYTHVDLAENMWRNPDETPNGLDDDGNGIIDDIYGADFANDNNGGNDGDPMDIAGHGTNIAGIIGAVGNNGIGIAGVNWEVGIMALKVFRPDGYAYDTDILEAINYVLAQKAKGVNIVAVNASYGGPYGSQSDPMNDAIKNLGSAGIVFCAAAGNNGKNSDVNASYPASYNAANIIAVAATDQNDALAPFSNYGAVSVDIAAPGVNIYSTHPGSGTLGFSDLLSGTGSAATPTASDSYGSYSGTSMAAPAVSGAAALVASRCPAESASARRAHILRYVDRLSSLKGKTATEGRLNLNNVLQAECIEDVDSGGGGGELSVYDSVSLLLYASGFLALGGMIARRRVVPQEE